MSTKRREIEAEFHNGTLLEAVSRRMQAEKTTFVEDCIALHNGGRIDLLELVASGAVERLGGHEFFVAQHFYCEAIPRLVLVSIDKMLGCVAKLVARGGADLAANRPNSALIEWLSADLSRAGAVVERARQGDGLAIDQLTFALQAMKDVQLARDMAVRLEGKGRLAALTALSRLPHSDEAERAATVTTAKTVLDGADDATRANVLSCVVHAFENGKAQLTPEAMTAIRDALAEPGDVTVHGAAHALLHADACLVPELVVLLTATCRHVKAQNGGTIDLMDSGLHECTRKGHGEAAAALVRHLLSRTDAPLGIEQFDSFAAALTQDDKGLGGVMVEWMLTGKRELCEAVSALVHKRRDGEAPLAITFDNSALTAEQVFFVCRKSIGYMFARPVVVGSVLIAALRSASAEWRDAIRELLFDPMLVNYGGALRDYLRGIAADDAAFEVVQDLLKRVDDHIAGLETAGTVKELHPSEYRRQLERIRMMDFNREVNKKARRQSIFHDIVHRSLLLHGRHSITFVEGVNGERRPVEMKLHTFEQSVEWPRMETVDPVGLEIRLLTFRAEQFTS